MSKPSQQAQSILKNKKKDIDPQAIQIIKKLKDCKFDGYLVGGGVRDLLVGLTPKDFDIATNATPQEVKRKVSQCFIIGRRFKLVHARRGNKIFEIATYRREATPEELETLSQMQEASEEELTHFKQENFFGTLEQDSFRRDFTINAIFFDPVDDQLVDYCGGLDDIENQTIRMIGDPTQRIKEDPIRILRALRLSQKLEFQIEPVLKKAIYENIHELSRSVLPRRREEWLKFFKLSHLEAAMMELYDLEVFKTVAPTLHPLFDDFDRRENFLSYVRHAHKLGFDFDSATEIFAIILYSFILATAEDPKNININNLVENESILNFTRNELGVFKLEFSSIMLSIQFIHQLLNRGKYLKKGPRRKASLLRNSHFDLALKLGMMAQVLTPADWLFWMNEKENFLVEDSGPVSE